MKRIKRELDECKTLDDVVGVLSAEIHTRCKRCRPPLTLRVGTDDRATECLPGGERKEYILFISSLYICLSTTTGCDLSCIGLDVSNEYIEITSDTVPSQRKKGYNTLMRSVAVVVSCFLGKPLVSEVSNEVSAYAMLKLFATTVVWKSSKVPDHWPHSQDFTEPVSDDLASSLKGKCAKIVVNPTRANLQRAIALFRASSVLCLDERPAKKPIPMVDLVP